jgi:O-antigen ligase
MLALELLGIVLIAIAAILASSHFRDLPFAFIIAVMATVLLQLVPLPPEFWVALPEREAIARGFDLLGIPRPWLPVSVTPYRSVMTLFGAIPALASLVAVIALRPGARWIAAAVVAGTVLSVLAGALQVANGPESWAYLYRITNTGAVGFFANQNHMATLLLISIPLGTVLFVLAKPSKAKSVGRYGLGIALLLLILGGIVLNGSLAVITLTPAVMLASASLLPSGLKWRRLALPGAFLALCGAIVFLVVSPVEAGQPESAALNSLDSRMEIWSITSAAIADSFPVGTGLGSFEQVYRQYEDPGSVTATYVNHAHNDYLELALELGLPGIVLILLFLIWWGAAVIRTWNSALGTPAARAGAIATAAVLAHSIVDFPLRTAAISAIFAACLGLMAEYSRAGAELKPDERRHSRHVKLG